MGKLFAVKTRLKLKSVHSTQNPEEIINAYDELKGAKDFTKSFERIGRNLYNEQAQILKLNVLLCESFLDIYEQDDKNKFLPFFKMSQKYQNLNNENEKYLDKMKAHL